MKKRIDNDKLLDVMEFGLDDNAVSHTETTGLVASAPVNDYELESYKDINKYQQKPMTNQKS